MPFSPGGGILEPFAWRGDDKGGGYTSYRNKTTGNVFEVRTSYDPKSDRAYQGGTAFENIMATGPRDRPESGVLVGAALGSLGGALAPLPPGAKPPPISPAITGGLKGATKVGVMDWATNPVNAPPSPIQPAPLTVPVGIKWGEADINLPDLAKTARDIWDRLNPPDLPSVRLPDLGPLRFPNPKLNLPEFGAPSLPSLPDWSGSGGGGGAGGSSAGGAGGSSAGGSGQGGSVNLTIAAPPFMPERASGYELLAPLAAAILGRSEEKPAAPPSFTAPSPVNLPTPVKETPSWIWILLALLVAGLLYVLSKKKG